VINLLGRTSFGQLAALARRAQVVVGNDTGPVHIMATAGAPTLVLFSAASDPLVSLPRGPRVAFMQENVLSELSAERVWHTLNEKLTRLE
jgi:ADP-heptose:LPS heptosyltransferase